MILLGQVVKTLPALSDECYILNKNFNINFKCEFRWKTKLNSFCEITFPFRKNLQERRLTIELQKIVRFMATYF